MELFHYEAKSGNFGDDLNLWFWDEVLAGWRDILPDHVLIGVGTLINDKLPAGRPKLIMGSGVGYGHRPVTPELIAESRIVALRGPASARFLGLPETTGVVDPAVLIADLARFSGIKTTGRAIFIPHVSSLHRFDWDRLCARAGIDFVSPAGETDAVIRRIAAAPLVIAESMHGAILADAFRTPWHAVSVSPDFNDFKWGDWAESLGIDLKVHSTMWKGPPVRDPVAADPTFGGGGSEGPGPEAGPGARASGIEGALRDLLRKPLRGFTIARRFARLAGLPGQLSDTALLEARKAELRRRFADVLDQVA